MEKTVSYELTLEEILEKFNVNIDEISNLGVQIKSEVVGGKLLISYSIIES